MPKSIALETVSKLASSGLLSRSVEVRLHAGEPLIAGVEYLSGFLSTLNMFSTSKLIHFNYSLQTNATLIDRSFCSLAREYNIKIGVSLDGPQVINDRQRITRSGNSTYAKVLKGIKNLNYFHIPFDIICVLTPSSLDFPEELFSFFVDIGARTIGYNLEESEGVNKSSTHAEENILERYKSFIQRTYEVSASTNIKIREIAEMEESILYGNIEKRNISNVPFAQVSVDARGQVYTFSPELLGLSHRKYGNFSLGNIQTNSINEMIVNSSQSIMYTDIERGVTRCRDRCKYFTVCGGGCPSNKLGETGSFDAMETWHCRARYKTLSNVVLKEIEKREITQNE